MTIYVNVHATNYTRSQVKNIVHTDFVKTLAAGQGVFTNHPQ